MKKTSLFLSLSFASSLLLASSNAQPNNQEILEIGKKSAATLAQTLGKNMKAHMKSGGPMDALTFCSSEADTLTQSVNKNLKAKAKRITLQARSAANVPTETEKKVLESLETLQKSGVTLPEYLVQKVGANEFKFYKPIIIDNGACLKCHGNLEEGELKKTIQARYPNDKATGYKMGDLRGAIVVDINSNTK